MKTFKITSILTGISNNSRCPIEWAKELASFERKFGQLHEAWMNTAPSQTTRRADIKSDMLDLQDEIIWMRDRIEGIWKERESNQALGVISE